MPVLAFGTTIARDGNVIAGLTNIGGLDIKMDTIDSTTHQSTGGFKEKIAALIDAGDIPISGYLDSTDASGQVALLTDMTNRTLQAFVITFPTSTGTTWTFNALVTGFKTGAPHDGLIPFDATLSISGVPTLGITLSNAITAMTLSGSGTINPVWAAAVYDYVYPVLTAVTSITLTPTFAAGVCTITCGTQVQTVATTVASSAITLGSAASVTTITVQVKETGKSPRTYTIKVSRA